MKINIQLTDEFVMRACHVFAMNDWLPHDWDYKGPERCECCKQRIGGIDNDGGENVKKQVANILEEILSDEPLDMEGYRDEDQS